MAGPSTRGAAPFSGSSSSGVLPARKEFLLISCLLLLLLAILLRNGYLPGRIMASNDAPLGRMISACHQLPGRFFGCWQDLNSVGYREGTMVPGITNAVQWALKPMLFSKIYPIIALSILGCSAWFFFRQSGLSSPACLLGALAATLNASYFSAACWGVGAQTVMIGLTFLALAALSDASSPLRWPRVLLAGLAVGLAVSEGADMGAFFSVYVAAFGMYQAFISEGPRVKNVALGAARVALVAAFAAWVAFRAISSLLAANVEGVAGMDQSEQTIEYRWDWATQWSLPKMETLSFFVPGLFGYRNDTPAGGQYWGAIGRAPAWDRYFAAGSQGTPPKGFVRYSGGGFYAGVAVVTLALWAGIQSLRGKASVFALPQRKWLWFWMATGGVSLLLAYGRFAPFYRAIYEVLPYSDTVRNPTKFIDLANFALVIIFAYGMDAFWRKYMRPAPSGLPGRPFQPAPAASSFDRRWMRGCGVLLVLSLLGWLLFWLNRQTLAAYLTTMRFNAPTAAAVSAFAVVQPGWFVLFFALTAGFMALAIRGLFAGETARWWGAALLGAVLVVDLCRANQLWIVTWDYKEKYASNLVLDQLKDRPYEHRVTVMPLKETTFNPMERLYKIEWLQNEMPSLNIQSLDIVQLPRRPLDLSMWDTNFFKPTNSADLNRLVPRCWQLTNTKYVFGPAGFLQHNQAVAPEYRDDFRLVQRFEIVAKPGHEGSLQEHDWTVVDTPAGQWALFEFTAALPRASLYSRWQTVTNGRAALDLLAQQSFDPAREIVVTGQAPEPPPADPAASRPGTVQFVSYHPKHISLKSDSSSPSILLLNDRLDSGWSCRVDGQPAPLLRCNFLMRGVYLAQGPHTIEFQFSLPAKNLYVSLAAIGVGLAVLGFVAVSAGLPKAAPGPPAARPPPPPAAPEPAPSNRADPKPAVQKAGSGNGSRGGGKRKR